MSEHEHEQALIGWLERREATCLERLRRLVDTNSGLDNPAGRLACLAQVEEVYRGLGFACERIERQGDMVHLIARRPGRPGAPKVLVLGHRLSEWSGKAPTLEEDIALSNISLDLTGQARALPSHT